MILITGGAGYIGSHTALNFLNSGFETVIFDSLEKGHIETVNMLQNEGKLHFVKGDLKNPDDIKGVFEQFDIDAVIHFAGYIEVEESVREPEKYYVNNVLGSKNLLDAMTAHNVKKIVFSSTCAVYGEPEYLPLDENHPRNPVNPYGRTKMQIEDMLKEYDEKYGLKSVILRYFNASGADSRARTGEWHTPETHLIPNILKSVLNKGRTFKIFGTDYDTIDGTCVRDYVNVEDMALAHKKAYEYLKSSNKSNVFNIGTASGYSVKQVFETAEKITGKKISFETAPRRAGDAAKLTADTKKASEVLGWRAEKSLADSIKTAYEWEKKLNKTRIF